MIFSIPIHLFRTIKELAKQHDYRFLYISGNAYKYPYNNRNQANILYDLITPQNVDGLILMSNLLSAHTSLEEFLARCLEYRPIPMVSLGLSLPGIPSVILDNFAGMYEAVCHLIEVHHFTRIAFLSGPWDHSHVKERFSAFSQVFKTHGLAVDQSLLLTGNFMSESGTEAVRELLEVRGKKPGKDVQAIVCCNDYMASGVMLELQRRGIPIPGEIAILGFDNIAIGAALTPPLSTVHQPFDVMAAKAMELMLKLLEGKAVAEIVKINSEFLPRCSCGCFYPEENYAEAPADDIKDSAFVNSTESFMEKLNPYILQTEQDKLSIWNPTLSMLREHFQENALPSRDLPREKTGTNSLMIMGRTAFNSFSQIGYQNIVYNMWSDMASTLELPVLTSILAKRLPQIGIKRGYLCLYENSDDFPGKLPPFSRLILAFDPSGRAELPEGGLRFPTNELLPAIIVEKHGAQNGVILSIYFHEVQIGYIILDHELPSEFTYWSLSIYLGVTMRGALLLLDLREHSRKLAVANATIQGFNEQLKSENLRIKAEMEVAMNLQTALLPRDIRDIHQDFEITASMLPAEQVGGDYYDVLLDKDGALWLGIGDVSGHGLIPGLIMMLAQTVHTCLTTNYNLNPAEALIMINKVMNISVQHRMQENHYMTCTLLKYQGEGVFQYSGMHLDLLIYHQVTGTCERIETRGLWLNVIDDIDQFTLNQEFKIQIGDILVLYSDGIIEAVNNAGQLLDMAGFTDLIGRHQTEDLNKMHDAIIASVLAWNAPPLSDDITLLLARRIR